MKYYSALFLLLVGLYLSGCSTIENKPRIEQVTVQKVQYLSLPDSFLQPCVLPKPPDKEVYLKSSLSKREELLTKLYLTALSVHRGCNIRLKNALKYQQEMIERYDQRNPETHP